MWVTLALLWSLSWGSPAVAQTVYYPDPPPGARPDSAVASPGNVPRDTTRPDSTRPGAAQAAPAAPTTPPPPPPPPAPVDPVVARACRDVGPGESAPDVLGIVFTRSSTVEARDAAIAAAAGKRIGGAPEDEFQYVQVPAGGSEVRLRAIADKVIRLEGVSEVAPILCPTVPAAPVRDSAAPPRSAAPGRG